MKGSEAVSVVANESRIRQVGKEDMSMLRTAQKEETFKVEAARIFEDSALKIKIPNEARVEHVHRIKASFVQRLFDMSNLLLDIYFENTDE